MSFAPLWRPLIRIWTASTSSAGAAIVAAPWLVVQSHRGAEAVATAYALVLGGQGDPRLGHMLAFGGTG